MKGYYPPSMPFTLWWHIRRTGHEVRYSRVSVPLFDMSARGDLWTCECERTWAR